MENKQLNLGVPLISARRYSSPQRLNVRDIEHDSFSKGSSMPYQQKPESKMDEIVKPGSVPFRWELSPGKSRDMSRPLIQNPEPPSATPKLPPGRTLDIVPWSSLKKSGKSKPVRDQDKLSGELNFIRTRNKPSDGSKILRPLNKLSKMSAPRPLSTYSGELNSSKERKLSSSHISSLSRLEGSGAGFRTNICSDPDKDDSAYTTVTNLFSHRESFSLCCNVDGVRSPGKISADEQAKEFMMGRFLPTPKAMTVESHHYASRRQLVVVGQSCEVKALASTVELPKPTKTDTETIPYRGYGLEAEESEDEDISCDLPSSVSVKACGFLPWFRPKSTSLRLLNPIPAMKVGTKAAFSSATKVGRLVKIMPEKSPGRICTKKKEVDAKVYASKLHTIEGKRTGKSRPMFYSGELHPKRSLSPTCRNSSQRSISPNSNISPHRLFFEGSGFVPVPKMVNQPKYWEPMPLDDGCKKSKEPSFGERSSTGHAHAISVAEKALYVDSESTDSVSQPDSNTSKSKSSAGNGARAAPICQPSLHVERWDIMKARGICSSPISEVVDGRHESDGTTKFNTSRNGTVKVLADGKCKNLSGQLLEKIDDQRHLAPPLLKSPSDSWLLRSLSSVSPRNSFSSSCLQNKTRLKKMNAPMPTPGVVR
ncbi:hypothetical protein Droror1_Dr00010337 [Drosera rotundifolia]